MCNCKLNYIQGVLKPNSIVSGNEVHPLSSDGFCNNTDRSGGTSTFQLAVRWVVLASREVDLNAF